MVKEINSKGHLYYYWVTEKPEQKGKFLYFVVRDAPRRQRGRPLPKIFTSKKDVLEHYPNLKGLI